MFTNLERNRIYIYLGASRVGAQVDPRVKNAIDAVEALGDTDLENQVRVILGYLAELDSQLLSGASKAKYKKVEDVEYNVGGLTGNLTQLANIFVQRLALIFGVEVLVNPYGGRVNGSVMRHG